MKTRGMQRLQGRGEILRKLQKSLSPWEEICSKQVKWAGSPVSLALLGYFFFFLIYRIKVEDFLFSFSFSRFLGYLIEQLNKSGEIFLSNRTTIQVLSNELGICEGDWQNEALRLENTVVMKPTASSMKPDGILTEELSWRVTLQFASVVCTPLLFVPRIWMPSPTPCPSL